MKKILFSLIFLYSTNFSHSQSWINSLYISGDSDNIPTSLVLDKSKNFYFLGWYTGILDVGGVQTTSKGDRDVLIVKYDPNLDIVWFKEIYGEEREISTDIGIDDQNNLFISGNTRGTATIDNNSVTTYDAFDGFVANISSFGLVNWFKNLFSGPGNQKIESTKVINNKLITLTSFTDTLFIGEPIQDTLYIRGNKDFAISQFNLDGNLEWTKQIHASNGITFMSDIQKIDNNIYMSGIFVDTIFIEEDTLISLNNDPDILLYCFDELSKEKKFTKLIKSKNSGYDFSYSMGSEGENLFISGHSDSDTLIIDNCEGSISELIFSQNSTYDIFLIKIDKEGSLLWTNSIESLGDNKCYDISVNQNVVTLTGSVSDKTVIGKDTLQTNSFLDQNAFIGLFSTGGLPISGIVVDAEGEDLDAGQSVFTNDENETFLVGYNYSSSISFRDTVYYNPILGKRDIFIAKYGCLPISLTTQTSTDLACNILNNGDPAQISLSAEGGFTELLYSIDGGQSFSADGNFYVNEPGEYPVVVADSTGCQILGDTITITQPEVFEIVSIDSSDEATFEGTDGHIIITPAGGTQPYEYSLNEGTPQTDSTFMGLSPGKYKVRVEDANNCGPLETDSITIEEYVCLPISLVSQSYSNLPCNVADGGDSARISFTAEGGSSGLLYSIDGVNYKTEGEFYVHNPGEYVALAKDSAGCEVILVTYNITQPEVFEITGIDTSDVSLHGGNDGYIIVTVAGGKTPYEYTLNEGTPQTDGAFMDLTAGKYQVVAQDANNCGPLETDSITIEEPPVGLQQMGVQSVKAYPNPVSEELKIEFTLESKKEERISIMDASGKIVMNKKYKAVNGKVSERLDVSGLRNGVYFLRIGDGGEVLKIVKE